MMAPDRKIVNPAGGAAGQSLESPSPLAGEGYRI